MSENNSSKAAVAMLIGVVLGVILGYLIPEFMLATDFIGRIFINALRIIVVPLIVASVVVGVTSLGDIRKVGRVGGKVITYFLATSTFAALMGLVLVYLFAPGDGVTVGSFSQQLIQNQPQPGSVTDIVTALVPENLIRSLAEGNFLGLILLSIFFGAALASLGKRNKTTVIFFKEVNTAMMKLVGMLMFVAPFGLLSIVGSIVAANGSSAAEFLPGLGWYSLTLLIGMVIHVVIVLPLILKFVAGESPWPFARNMLPAFLTAIGTSSSSATLPVTYECVVEKNKVDERAGSFVLPLGMTVNMNGSAMYVVIATIFIAQVFGVSISATQMITVVAMAVLISIAAAGVPSAALFMLATVFAAIGMPAEAYAGIGLILVVDWILDRGRTVTNIWGDAVGAAVIGNSFEMKTARRAPTSRERQSSRPTRTRTRPGGERTRSGEERPRSGEERPRPDRRGPREDRESGRSRQRDGSPGSGGIDRGRERRAPRTGRPSSSQSQRGRRQDDEPSPFEIVASDRPILQEAPVQSGPADEPPRESASSSRTTNRTSDSPTGSRTRRPQSDRSSDRNERNSRRRSSPVSEPKEPRSNGNRGRRVTAKEEELSQVASRPPEDESARTAPPAPRLSQEKIKQELEKVSAQLGNSESAPQESDKRDRPVTSREDRAGSTYTPEVESRTEAEPTDKPTSPPAQTQEAETVQKEVGQSFDLPLESAGKSPERESESQSEQQGSNEPEPVEELRFGRGRARKGERVKPITSPPASSKTETAEESYSKEKVEFGRGKRKKTGR